MTDRLKALTVILEEPIRDDDCQPIIAAILCLKGVADVSTHVADFDHYVAVSQAQRDLEQRILAVLRDKP